MNGIVKPTLAEFIGTFTLVFIGALTGAQAEASGAGLVGVALAHGLTLMVIIYTWGSVSGAHVNPAVTLGLCVGGRIEFPKAIAYWIAQFAGGVAAGYLVRALVPDSGLGQTTGSLTPVGAQAGNIPLLLTVEAVLTFFLVCAVYASGVLNKNGHLVGVAIGLVLTMDILAGGPLTGASMNPARTFGPALAKGELSYFWMYLVGPAIGGIVAAVISEQLLAADSRKA